MSDEKNSAPVDNPFEVQHDEAESPSSTEPSSPKKEDEPREKIDEDAFLAELEEAEEEEDHGDGDGGFFWVLRRVVTEILKVIVVLGLIGLVIWLIWGGNNDSGSSDKKEQKSVEKTEKGSESAKEKDKKATKKEKKDSKQTKQTSQQKEEVQNAQPETKQEKKGWFGFGKGSEDKDSQDDLSETDTSDEETSDNTESTPKRVPVSLNDLSYIIADAEFLAYQEYQAGEDLMEQTMAWLRQTRQFSELGVNQVVQYADPIERATKIEEKIQEGDFLLEQAKQLKIALNQEVGFWQQKNTQDTEMTKQLNQEYKAILQNIDVQELNQKLRELTQARRQIAESQTYLSAYTSLLKNVNNFERLLKSKVIPVYRPNAPKPVESQ